MGQRKYDHTHMYERVRLGKNKDYIIFRCRQPKCTHFLVPATIVGKACVCYVCGNEFILETKHKQTRWPHCNNCRVRGVIDKTLQNIIKKEESPKPTPDELIIRFKKRFGT